MFFIFLILIYQNDKKNTKKYYFKTKNINLLKNMVGLQSQIIP